MTEKTKKDNKNLIICICAAVVVVVIAIIAIVFATKGSAPIDDSYFVSDDSKYVISLTSDNLDYEDDEYAEYAPLVSHVVYYYSGDKITGMKTYHEYENADAAKEAYDALKASVCKNTDAAFPAFNITFCRAFRKRKQLGITAVLLSLPVINKCRSLRRAVRIIAQHFRKGRKKHRHDPLKNQNKNEKYVAFS